MNAIPYLTTERPEPGPLRPFLALIALALLAADPALAASTHRSDAAALLRGRMTAEMRCGLCHAVGREDESRTAPAPPFRELHRAYPVADLISAIAEGATAHAGMPRQRMSLREARDLIAYIQSLEH